MGCSGALFGLLGYQIVDAIITWKDVRSPRTRFAKLMIVLLISLAVGLLPGLDNFTHLGGLIMGILLSILMTAFHPSSTLTATICTWISKLIAFVLAIALYVGFLLIFYTAEDLDNVCPKCKYFSCIPSSGWCDV